MLNSKARKVMLTRGDLLMKKLYFQDKEKTEVKSNTMIENENEEESIIAEEPSISEQQ